MIFNVIQIIFIVCNNCYDNNNNYINIKYISTTNELPKNVSFSNEYCFNNYDTVLASIHNNNDLIQSKLICNLTNNITSSKARRGWIGLNDIIQENQFKFFDGTTFDYGILINGNGTYPWFNGEPNDEFSEDCVELEVNLNDFGYNDVGCYHKFNALCNAPSEICNILLMVIGHFIKVYNMVVVN